MNSNSPRRSIRFDPFLSRLLNRIPHHIVDSFTEAQLEALRNAMINSERHKLDIRLSVPAPFHRFYVVLLAGPERRSKARRLRDGFRFWTPANVAFLLFLLSSIAATIYSGLHLLQPLAPSVSAEQSYPTALPWIDAEEDCLGRERQWRDGMCFDSAHQAEF